MRAALTPNDISGFLALVFEIPQGFVVAAEWIDVCPQKEAVAGGAFKLSDPPHGFPDCLKTPDKAPLSRFVRHVQLPHGQWFASDRGQCQSPIRWLLENLVVKNLVVKNLS